MDAIADRVAREIVDCLVTTCLEMVPAFFETLGLPGKVDALERITPYELALELFKRWEHTEELLAQIQPILPDWKHDLIQFCVQAILYRFNILLQPKYRQLFICPSHG